MFTILPRDARSASAVLLSLSRPSICLACSVRLSVTLRYRQHIGQTSSKLIT